MELISKREAKASGKKHYFTGVPCLRGHIDQRVASSGQCLSCAREKYHEDMLDPVKLAARRARESARMNDERREKMRNSSRERRSNPATGDAVRERSREYHRSRTLSDPVYVATIRIRSATRAAFYRSDLKKPARTEALLGCTILEAKAQIERQWLPGMTWLNYGGAWHIDHIVPISSASSVEEMELLCRVGNLRPIWALDNLKKKAKKTHLL